MKRFKIVDFVFLLVGVIGIGFLLYPLYADYKLNKAQTVEIQTYEIKNSKLSKNEKDKAKEKLKEENEKQEQKTNTGDPFNKTNTFDLKESKLPEVVGVLEIPKIDLKIQIYPTTNELALERGVGVLEGSALPIGGKNKHSVITGHRGLSLGEMFTDLPRLKMGDHFYIKVLNETHAYEVDKIKTITPDNMDNFGKEENKDLITLVTCTPLGVNSHRLLVRGHRVPYTPEQKENATFWTFKKLLVTGILSIFFVFILLYILNKSKKKKKVKNERA
ncbi:class C sortase [Lactococcus petauri]|uniref:class C sortase n=1 Tax=Lactococcus petauri TaxID=1940789 RepID=UPI00254C27FE|nr:class C sortase [Lactococcus petauri]